MLKKILYLVCFLLITYSSSASAFPNEPNGFRDLYWGETLQEVQKKHSTTYLNYSAKENSVMYTIPLIDKNIGGVYSNMPTIILSFWNNQLCYIMIGFSNETLVSSQYTYDDLRNSLKLNFGIPLFDTYIHEANCDTAMWIGEATTIVVQRFRYPMNNKYLNTVTIGSKSLREAARKDGASKGW